MRYIKGYDRKQLTMLPDCIDDLIGQDNPVRVIDVFIDGLDMKDSGFQRYVPNVTGRPPYNPRDLFKLYVYGYFNKIRSSRKLMAEYEVTNHNTDQGLLKEVAESAKKNLEVEAIEVVADKGYESRKDILNCVMNGIVPNVALKYDKHERLYTINYVEAQINDEERNSTKPEDIQKCIAAGVLPTCYENTAIDVEIQEQSVLSCFTLNENGTVTCPMGNILSKTTVKGKSTRYANKDACRQCPNRCTGSKNPKTVSFGPNTKYVPVKMFGSVKFKLNSIPNDIIQNIPYNSFNRKDEIKKKVVLKIKEDINKIKERMCLSEHPFGTVKWYHGAHYLLCKGKEKTSAELGLSFLAYNLKRAINMIGVQGLIAAL